MMDGEKRLILAIALSVLVILAYQSYMSKYAKPYQAQQLRQPETSQTTTEVIEAYQPTKPRQQINEDVYQIANELYNAELTSNGACIKQLSLRRYKSNNAPIELLKKNTDYPRVLETQDLADAGKINSWQIVARTDNKILFRTEDGKKEVTKKIEFHNTKYNIELELIFQNKTAGPQEIYYKIFAGPGVIKNEYMDVRYLSADLQVGEKVTRRKPNSKGIKNNSCEIFNANTKWVSSTSRYFAFILKPEQEESRSFVEGAGKNNLVTGIIIGPTILQPAEVMQRRYILYAGPNDIEKINAVGVPAESVINYGILGGIAHIIFKSLQFFYKISGNYGLAIILIALAISIILLPLTKKSLKSIKDMQKIQPEVERLKKEYSDNPQKMNKETMELYKKYKINPFGGCFPMLLQLPIFIALYNVFTRSVELKGAEFLWIKDLSEPDAAFRLPYNLPLLGSYINILPIMMAVTMILQQKMTQPKGMEASEQQRIMAIFMPIFMCIIFYNLPSGMVLYWVINTIIMLLLQELVLKTKQPQPA